MGCDMFVGDDGLIFEGFCETRKCGMYVNGVIIVLYLIMD